MPVSRRGFACWIVFLLCSGTFTLAWPANENPEKEAAEARLARVKNEIAALKAEIAGSRTEHQEEQENLRQLDLQVQELNRQQRELQGQRDQQLAELDRVEAEKERFLASLDERQAQLVEQVRAAYQLGRQSRLKLLLNQDSPADLSRMLAYYDYVNRAQIEKISGLKDTLAQLDSLQLAIDRELIRLDEVQKNLDAAQEELKRQRVNRTNLLAEMEQQIADSEFQLEELNRNQQDLEALIERLADVLADIPDDLAQQVSVRQRKGNLPMPVRGPVKHAFGQPRAGGIRWQGWLIGADPGTEVAAVAHGRVAFADWLRGYGLLIIIDHGEGFMSLYGNNEILLHDVGDWVESGEPISAVGAGTGNNQGLYFELRHDGKVVDPVVWLKR